MNDLIEPRPTEADAPVVRYPDSVTHYVCAAAPFPGSTHHITKQGNCQYCKELHVLLRLRYAL